MQLECQMPPFFTSLSVVESCRCECRDLQRHSACRKTQQLYVANLHDPLWNHNVTPAVVESHAPVAQSITLDGRRIGLPACPSQRSSDLNVQHLRGRMTNSTRRFQASQARRAQESSPVRQHWENDGPASAPERGGRNRVAVLLSPRSGAGKCRPPATHGSAPWATIFRPSGSAQLPTEPRRKAAVVIRRLTVSSSERTR